ncbi:MAG: prephenate dehydrogenase [Candidatus Firestonebacteria bacterium]
MKRINTVVIYGVGLIGGSLGKAFIKKHLARKVIGIGRNVQKLKKAVREKAIIEFSTDFKRIKEADLVILATSVIHIEKTLKKISPFLKDGCLVTDVGSTKERIVNVASKFLRRKIYFVGSHPIAGSEKSGVDFSSAELFKGSVCVLTPTKNTNKDALKVIRNLWEKLGAKVIITRPKEHDEIIALTSHLPHFIACALVLLISKDKKNLFSMIGKGFKDTTRIAGSNPEIWSEIAISNKKNISCNIKNFLKIIKKINNSLNKNNVKNLKKLFLKAKSIREKIY